jgi:hypothetical protein
MLSPRPPCGQTGFKLHRPTMANHMFPRVSKPAASHASAERHTLRMCGNRNKIPLCIPVPSPMDDSTPRPTHQIEGSVRTSNRPRLEHD